MRFFSSRNKEIAEEIEAHLRMAEQDGIAQREFGSTLLVRETTRDVWGWTRIEKFVRDLRYAVRQMRRTPGFAVIAILTLALGLGATTAMFSIVNSVLLEPLKYRDPGRLYAAVNLPSPKAPTLGLWLVNARHFHEWRTHCQSCEDVALATSAAGASAGVTLTGLGEPYVFPALYVSSNFFRTLGVQPAMGRDFRPEEELPGKNDELILSDSIWRSQFGRDANVIGRAVRVNGKPVTIVGVMPPDFRLPVGNQWGPDILNATNAAQATMFVPLGTDVSKAKGDGGYNYVSVVRLKPGATPAQAAAEFYSSIAEFVREFHIGLKPALFPLQETITRRARAGLWLLLGTVGAVLLIVCVNIGNLMLVRTASRDREAGIRMALGSSRAELFRLVLSEALMLVAIGSLLGVALAYGALKLFVAAAPVELPRIGEVHMDARALGFALAAAFLSTLICGLFPAWKLARTDPQQSIKQGIRSQKPGGRMGTREVLVGAEAALSTLLLVIGGLLGASFYRVMSAPKGFEAAHVIAQDVTLAGAKYTDKDRLRFVDEALGRLERIPGVQAVGMTNWLPIRGETWICTLWDATLPDKRGIAPANFRFVSPGYWTAMGIPLKKGRLIAASDRGRAVGLLSERAAQMLWPGQNPIGKHVGGCGDSDAPNSLEVIGVVADVRAGLEKEPPVTVYQGYWDSTFGSRSFAIRTQADPAAVISAVRKTLRSIDSEASLSTTTTMEQIIDDSAAARRFETTLAVAFATAALALASLGVYGVISFSVARRTPEIGIRIALGARAPQLAAMVLRQGMTPVLIGLAAGLGCALLAGRFIASQLYDVAPHDPATICAACAVLLIVAAAACWIPARRAVRIDPTTALRFE
ncbi:MAG TPA: ABC transporter permease [Bryobacteraceae bacterium]